MKTTHLHFTGDRTPEVRVRLLAPSNEARAAYGVDITIAEVEHTAFFRSPDARAEWLKGLRAQIDAALEATTVAPDDVIPAAQVAI